MSLVLIDVDGTLLSGPSSEFQFIQYLVRHRVLGLRQHRALLWFSIRRMPQFKRHVWKKNKAYLTGLETGHVHELAERFIQQHLIKQLRPVMKERINRHLQNGDTLALLTGTPDFIAEPLARRLNIEHWIATRCVQCDGRYISDLPLEHPFAEGKILAAERFCHSMGFKLSECIAYADSIHDRLLLGRVAMPIAVEPGRKLQRVAQRNGWEILKFLPSVAIG